MRTKPTNWTDREWEHSEYMRSLTNQPVSEDTGQRMERLRSYAKAYGSALVMHLPPGREKALAKTHLEDSVMWAIKALALHDDEPEAPAAAVQQRLTLVQKAA